MTQPSPLGLGFRPVCNHKGGNDLQGASGRAAATGHSVARCPGHPREHGGCVLRTGWRLAHRLRQPTRARILGSDGDRGHRPGHLGTVPPDGRHAERARAARGPRGTAGRHVRGAVADHRNLGVGQCRSLARWRHRLLARHQRADRGREGAAQLRGRVGARGRRAHPRVEPGGGGTAPLARPLQRDFRALAHRPRLHGRPAGRPHRLRGRQSGVGTTFRLQPRVRSSGNRWRRPCRRTRRHSPQCSIAAPSSCGSPSSTSTPRACRSARCRAGPTWCRCPATAVGSSTCCSRRST